MSEPISISVTEDDIRTGEVKSCFRCAVALALQRCTGDSHANVYDTYDGVFLEVHSRHTRVPSEVRQFVSDFDHLPRDPRTDRPVLTETLPQEVQPFSFELPSSDAPEWQERCYGCEELFDPNELDDEGNCPECHAEGEQE